MLQYNDTQVYIKPVAILLAIYFLFLIKMSAVTQYSISGTTCITRQSALEKCFNTVKYVIVRVHLSVPLNGNHFRGFLGTDKFER